MSRRASAALVVALGACGAEASQAPFELETVLVESVAPRPFEARLADAATYARCDRAFLVMGRCSPPPAPRTPAFDRLSDATRVVRDAHRTGAGSPRVEGLAELLWHGTAGGDLERSVEALVRAVGDTPEDWRALNDLAVAYLARARAGGTRMDVLRALDLLGRPDGLAPPPVLFNRALVLEALGLPRPAVDAWDTFLSGDSVSGWADEARSRRADAMRLLDERGRASSEELRRAYRDGDPVALGRLAALHPQEARELALEELLPNAMAVEGGGSERFRALAALGDALHDRSVVDIVEGLESLRRTRDSREAGRIRQAMRSFEAASALWSEGLYEEAIEAYRASVSGAGDDIPAVAAWAALGMGMSHLYRFRYDEAARHFETVLEQADSVRYPLQVGQAMWGQGLIAGRLGDLEEAWRLLAGAADRFRRAGEHRNAASLRANAAEALAQLGRGRDAWSYRLEALAALGREPVTSALHFTLWYAAEAARAEGLPHAARLLHDVDVDVARHLTESWALPEALVRRSGARLALGDTAGARRDLAEARARTEAIENAEDRARSLADVQEWEARRIMGTDPRAAVALLDSVLDLHQRLGNRVYVARTVADRAGARAALADHEAAHSDLEWAVEMIEGQRSTISGVLRGASFAEAWAAIFDAAISHHLGEGHDPWRALDYAERSRALFVSPEDGEGSLPWWDDGRRPDVPATTLMVQYAVVDGVVARWTLGSDRRTFRRLAPSADSLAALTRRFVDGVQRGEVVAEQARRLAEVLLPPLAPTMPTRIVVVGDRFLNGIPFQALPVPSTGRILVEASAVSMAPSFAFHLSGPEGTVPLGDDPSALLVGNPRAAADPDPLLVDLPGADREVERLGELYPRSRMLTGGQATRRGFLTELDRHPVVHFAGHAFFDEQFPEASHLALSGNSGAADRLYMRELAGTSFRRLSLVVLSACSSAAPTDGRGGGLMGLAFPFLEGGVPTVVGSLWPVDDRVAGAVTTRFHENLLRGAEPAGALREAQAVLATSSDPTLSSPAAWAGFQVLGR